MISKIPTTNRDFFVDERGFCAKISFAITSGFSERVEFDDLDLCVSKILAYRSPSSLSQAQLKLLHNHLSN